MIDLDRLRDGGPSCPSDLRLDRLAAGELPREDAVTIEAHARGCPDCHARLAERRQGFAAFPEARPDAMLGHVQRAIRRRRRPRFAAAAAALAAAAAVVLFLRAPTKPHDVAAPAPLGVRTKGSLVLRVFRHVDGGAEELTSGARVATGDRLRFVVSLPSPGQTEIVGIEAKGTLYRAWPLDPATSTRRPAGPDQELEGAIVLDESKGRETLYLVHCPARRDAPVCSVDEGRPRCPDGCSLSPFVLDKGP